MKNKFSMIASMIFALASTGAMAQSATPPNDAQIAGIVVAANSVDINAGQLAKSKTHKTVVKKFAEQMIKDHTSVNKSASALVNKLKVTPEDSPTSTSLKQDGAATLKKLKGMSGPAFDKAYIDNEVAYHQSVLDAVDKTLLPNASNQELKDLIAKVRPAFVAHLEHAKQMQSKMQGTS
jgi:putative membrane protein